MELALYEIHEATYDPLKKITDFWEKYDLIAIQDTIKTLLKNAPEYRKSGNVIQLCHKQVFSADLFRLLVAYFIVHMRHIEINCINLSQAETTQVSQDELSITKRIHDLFEKIAE